ncbi:MAG: hypothetical protein JWO58_1142 [Chitinophagaceae bacterium]|nr:hypothetical protein [Chitinophagaceae bacterium]
MYKAVASARLFFFCLFCLLMTMSVHAQVLKFEQQEIDLGYIPEDTGNVVIDFKLSNASTASAIISDIDTHGGCSIVIYPKDTLAAGAKGKITVRINPKNRPGPFVRKITLHSFPDSASYDLYIKSYVEPSMKVWNQNTNETTYGSVVVSSDYIRVGNVSEQTKIEKSLKFKNTGKETIRFVASKFKKPAYVTLKGLPEKMLSGEEATVIFTIDFSIANKLGTYTDMVELYAEPGSQKEIFIYLIGKIMPVPVASPNKPMVQMPMKEFDLHDISADKPAQGSFVMKNTGASPLIIRKVETNCSCLTLDAATPLPAGESKTLYFALDPRGLSGLEEKKIMLYTNAPDQPIITLIVKAKVGT